MLKILHLWFRLSILRFLLQASWTLSNLVFVGELAGLVRDFSLGNMQTRENVSVWLRFGSANQWTPKVNEFERETSLPFLAGDLCPGWITRRVLLSYHSRFSGWPQAARIVLIHSPYLLGNENQLYVEAVTVFMLMLTTYFPRPIAGLLCYILLFMGAAQWCTSLW